jgi:TonB-dependent starch-binding outer membrane protein SusC
MQFMPKTAAAQMLRIMRLTSFLLLAFCIHLSARTHSQAITLSVRNAPLKEIFTVIKKQTGYFVFYKNDLLADARPVSLSVSSMPLEDFLNIMLKDQSLSYKITDKTIMLFRKPEPPAEKPLMTEIPIISPADLPPVTVQGQVVFNGKPVAGASVVLRPGNRGTATGDNGFFTLPNVVPGQYTLTVSSIGYKKAIKKIVVADVPLILNISLEQALDEVEEVVVTTGYSIKKTGELTGSVQKISGDELRKGITTSDPVSLLKGRATGLYISEQNAGDPTSSGGQIFVRGQSSIAGVGVDQTNEFVMPTLNYGPLLVLDGVIMPNQNLKEMVTPQEIEDITILKDAAATAIYGSRAAAGVLVVNTKRGKEGRPRVSAEVKYGLNEPNRGSLHFLGGQGLYDLQKEYYTENYQQNNGSLAPQYPTLQAYLDNRLPSPDDVAHSFDWTKYAFISSNTKEVNLSASGGNEKTKYYMGGTYYNEQSTGVDNGLKRYSFRLNLESRLSDRLTANVSINAIINDGKREETNSGTFLYGLIPWANPYNANGSPRPYLNYKMDGATQQAANPLYDNQWNYMSLRSQLLFGSVKLEYRLTDWLILSTTNSGNLNYMKNERYIDVRSFEGSGTPYSSQGFLGTTTNYLNSYLTSNQLNFHKTFGDHSLTALAAMEYGMTGNENMTVNVNNVRAGYPVISLGRLVGGAYDFSIYGIPSTKSGNIEGGKELQAVYSLFGEVGYNYRKRYSLSGSVRRDASSSFGPDNRYGTFYSGGAAWIVSGEDFMKSIKAVSNLKLRANYGTSGSQLGDNFLTQTLYDPSYTYSGQGAAQISILGNPNLRWEVTKTFSGGFDLGLFKRINATVDFYNRRSQDLLQKVTLPSLSGFPTQWQNVAEVRNNGLEILINSENIVRKNFRWSTSFNISFNRNRILHVANDSLRQGFYSANSYYLFKGDDINTLKAVKYAGVDPQTGKPRFEKLLFDAKGSVNGKEYVNTLDEVNATSDTRQFQTIGSFQPKYYGGLTNTFSYKQFSLNILITYAVKYTIHDDYAEQMQGTSPTSNNQIAYLKSQVQWTHPGQTNATDPSVYYQATTSFFGSSKYMHDGTNARLRSVRLSYDLPAGMMKRWKMANCTVYVSGDNLYTVYSKNIVASDPEGPSVGQAQSFGLSNGSNIGVPRRYVFGLQANF